MTLVMEATAIQESDPLSYLDGYERLLCGWVVTRMFATRTPRFAKALTKYGPEGMAYYATARTFAFYCFPLVILGFLTGAISAALSNLCFALLGICWLLGTRRFISMIRAGKKFRRLRPDTA